MQITDGIGEDEAVARAHRFNDTAGNVILAATRVRVVHRVEFAAATRNLATGSAHIRERPKKTYLLLPRISRDMLSVRRVFNEIRPAGS